MEKKKKRRKHENIRRLVEGRKSFFFFCWKLREKIKREKISPRAVAAAVRTIAISFVGMVRRQEKEKEKWHNITYIIRFFCMHYFVLLPDYSPYFFPFLSLCSFALHFLFIPPDTLFEFIFFNQLYAGCFFFVCIRNFVVEKLNFWLDHNGGNDCEWHVIKCKRSYLLQQVPSSLSLG